MTRNRDVAACFERLADLLEIEGENPFRVRAYRNAARTISSLSPRLSDLVARDSDLTELPGIGDDLAGKIRELVTRGRLPLLDDVARRVPPELSDLMRVRGLGPKGVKALYDHFHMRSLRELERIAEAGQVRALAGFGAKKEAALLDGIRQLRRGGERRTRLADAEPEAERLKAWLAAGAGVQRVEIAGSYRRRRETVGDLDIVVSCSDGAAAMDRLAEQEDVAHVASRGETRSTVILGSGLQVDVRAVTAESFGAALLYFTGSKEHNVELRQRAIDRHWKLNEYGLFDGERPLVGREEADIYARLGLDWIPPELREHRGEIEWAATGRLPPLVTADEMRGNLHAHTTWSDGRDTLEEMARAARAVGHDYLAITDHGPKVRVANGLDPRRLRRQMREIDRMNEQLEGLVLLKGCEVDILGDGALDLPDDVLAKLDVVVCSIHYHLRLDREAQTERVLRAMDNPHFMIWGHPTAREINRREPIDIDLGRCLAAASERGILVEINAQPKRLDLNDTNARLALEQGCDLVIDTDAHSVSDLELMRHGVDQARRAGAPADRIANTRGLAALRRRLRHA